MLESSVAPSQGNEDELVLEAMANPYGGKSLKELAVGKKTCAIIISDHTRPVPSKHIIPFMLAELREGNPDIEITLLVATGFHRPTITDELRAKLGDEIVDSERIVIHDAFDADSNVKIGVLPSGADLVIDRVASRTSSPVSQVGARASCLACAMPSRSWATTARSSSPAPTPARACSMATRCTTTWSTRRVRPSSLTSSTS